MRKTLLALLLLPALASGCKFVPDDSGDTAYNGQGRVHGPDQGWRPTVVVTPAERR